MFLLSSVHCTSQLKLVDKFGNLNSIRGHEPLTPTPRQVSHEAPMYIVKCGDKFYHKLVSSVLSYASFCIRKCYSQC